MKKKSNVIPGNGGGTLSEYYVLSFSGGKDSTALGLEWLKRHQQDPITYPLHEVISCDVGMDFPAMYDHIDRMEAIFTKAGIRFTRLKADQTFEYLMFDHWPNFRENSKFQNQGYSWPSFQSRWCTTLLKTEIIDGYLKQLRTQYTVIQLIGLAADEEERLQKKNNQLPNHRHPLVEWGWDEAFCLEYCYDRGFDWDGLYKLFHRVSCWCCPLQSLPELRNLRKHFPDLWNQMLDMEHRTWRKFRSDYSVDELDIRFQFEEERLAVGLPINTREFYQALKKRIQEVKENEKAQ